MLCNFTSFIEKHRDKSHDLSLTLTKMLFSELLGLAKMLSVMNKGSFSAHTVSDNGESVLKICSNVCWTPLSKDDFLKITPRSTEHFSAHSCKYGKAKENTIKELLSLSFLLPSHLCPMQVVRDQRLWLIYWTVPNILFSYQGTSRIIHDPLIRHSDHLLRLRYCSIVVCSQHNLFRTTLVLCSATTSCYYC